MHLSETVVLGPAETPEGTARVRIFTPGREVPFAGHPTVGSAIFLAANGHAGPLPEEGEVTVVLEENVGPVPVVVRCEYGEPVFARFTTAVLPEHPPAPHSAADLAAMVGLSAEDVCDGEPSYGLGGPNGLSPEMVSCGLPYYCIPVESVDAVNRSALDMPLWKSMGVATGWEDVDVHVRMYAPGSGVPEDPATGSAAAALSGYLSAADGREEGTLSWTVEQGIKMGRPSLLYVEADRSGGETTAVRVGGTAAFVSSSMMEVPNP